MYKKFLIYFLTCSFLYAVYPQSSPKEVLYLRFVDLLYGKKFETKIPCSVIFNSGDLIIRPRICVKYLKSGKKVGFIEIWKKIKQCHIKKREKMANIKLAYSSWIVQGEGIWVENYYIDLLDCLTAYKS